jgi:hypothetical protein
LGTSTCEGEAVDFSPVGKVCSFCGLVGVKGTKFAGGLGAMMCADCLEYYHGVFASAERTAAITRPPWDDMTDAELLSKLPLISMSADQVNEFLGQWVALLRSRKLSWAEIGKVMGVSRQAAWERFSGSVGDESKDATA